MKTFREFLLEATIQQLMAQANAARQKGDMETFIELQKQAAELGKGTQAKISAAVNKGQKKQKVNPNTWVSGRASKPESPTSSVGTTANVRRRRVTDIRTGSDLGPAEPSDTRTSGRYGTVPGGRGTRVSRSGGIIGR